MGAQRKVSLFRNGRSQAVRIPREFELSGSHVIMRRDGKRLIIEAESDDERLSLGEWLAMQEPLPPECWIGPIEDYPPEPVDL